MNDAIRDCGPIGPTGTALEIRVNTNPLEQSSKIQIVAGIYSVKQRADHHHAYRRDVLLQPGSMLNADCMMVRQGSTGINEAR